MNAKRMGLLRTLCEQLIRRYEPWRAVHDTVPLDGIRVLATALPEALDEVERLRTGLDELTARLGSVESTFVAHIIERDALRERAKEAERLCVVLKDRVVLFHESTTQEEFATWSEQVEEMRERLRDDTNT